MDLPTPEDWSSNGITEHCVVAINNNTFMVIGGQDQSTFQKTKATKFYFIEERKWVDGPELRGGSSYKHTCAAINYNDGNEDFVEVFVTGGLPSKRRAADFETLRLPQNFNPDEVTTMINDRGGWAISALKVPFSSSTDVQLVEMPERDNFLIMSPSKRTIYSANRKNWISGPWTGRMNEDWKELDVELPFEVKDLKAFFIPDGFVQCRPQ